MWSLCRRCSNLVQDTGFFEDLSNGIGGLGALAEPFQDLYFIKLNDGRVLGGVVCAHVLNKTAIPAAALVCNYDLVERSFFSACAGKPDLCCHGDSS